jgi:aromatic-L-amino-acid decarboxylase
MLRDGMDTSDDSIVERLAALEREARTLEPGGDERDAWLGGVRAFAEDFLQSLPARPAYDDVEGPGRPLDELAIRDTPTPLSDLLETYSRQALSVHLNPASPRFFGYIPGGGLYAAALGDYLAAVTNRYAGVFFASPGAARIESATVRWIAQTLGYPSTAGGTLTSGGSLANLSAVIVAREQVLPDDRHRAVVYMTSQVHHSMQKALQAAGMGAAVVRSVPVDDAYRMQPAALARQIEDDRRDGLRPWLLVSSAGTVNTGSVDPLDELADVASRYGLWHHIDAAYGGFFVMCEPGRRVLRGIERGDSITVDPHKGLFLPYGCGCVIVRDHAKLRDTHAAFAEYMQDVKIPPDEASPADYSLELTRHFRGLRLWLPLRLAGLAPFRAAIEEKMLLARWFHEQLAADPDFECGPCPELSVATFRHRPRATIASRGTAVPPSRGTGVSPVDDALDRLNLDLASAIHRDGRVFLSSTRLPRPNGDPPRVYLRLAVLSFRSHFEHVSEALNVVRRLTRGMGR